MSTDTQTLHLLFQLQPLPCHCDPFCRKAFTNKLTKTPCLRTSFVDQFPPQSVLPPSHLQAPFFVSLVSSFPLAWMPDELSPAHNIVCWGCSVWHRSVEEKLWPITNQSDQSNCQDGLYTMMNRWSDQSNCQGGLHTMLDRSPVRSSRAAGLPGRGAPGPRSSGPPHGGHTGLVPGSGEERCLCAAGSTHIWRHSALFSPVNTKTSERASAAEVTYYVLRVWQRQATFPLLNATFIFLSCAPGSVISPPHNDSRARGSFRLLSHTIKARNIAWRLLTNHRDTRGLEMFFLSGILHPSWIMLCLRLPLWCLC